MRRRPTGIIAVGVLFGALLVAGCGTTATPAKRHSVRPQATPTATVPGQPSPSPSASPSPSPPASGNSVDLTFQGAVTGSMSQLAGQDCSASEGVVKVAFEGPVGGESYFVTIEIADPQLAAGSWSISSPASQRQGGLENLTPSVGKVGPGPSTAQFEAAPGSSGTVTLVAVPAGSGTLLGQLDVTLMPVAARQASGSLDLSGAFSCEI